MVSCAATNNAKRQTNFALSYRKFIFAFFNHSSLVPKDFLSSSFLRYALRLATVISDAFPAHEKEGIPLSASPFNNVLYTLSNPAFVSAALHSV